MFLSVQKELTGCSGSWTLPKQARVPQGKCRQSKQHGIRNISKSCVKILWEVGLHKDREVPTRCSNMDCFSKLGKIVFTERQSQIKSGFNCSPPLEEIIMWTGQRYSLTLQRQPYCYMNVANQYVVHLELTQCQLYLSNKMRKI